jgi:hypothetical protein
MKMAIADVAYSLSNVNSFNGHLGQYSTAQHSCLVSDLLGGSYCGLMHDGHEAICGDVSTPVKNALNLLGNGVWREFENAIAKRFCHYWGVTFPFPEEVHKADHLSRRIEVASLASNEMKTSLRKLGLEPLYNEWMIQEVWTPDRAFNEFMDRFNKLGPTGRVR